MNKLFWAHLAVLMVNLIYGANYFIAKGVMPDYLPPNFFILLRIVGAGSLFWLIRFFMWEKIERKDYLLIAACGLFGISANQLMFFQGLSRTSAVDGSIIMVCTPVLVTVFSFLILKNKITINKAIGIIIGLVGAIFLVYLGSKNTENTGSSLIGNLFILGNATSYAIYIVIVKPLMAKYKPITVVSMVFTFATVYTLPFAIFDFTELGTSFPTEIIYAILYVVLFSTFATYLLNIYGISKLPPTVVSSYIYLQPVFAMLIAVGISWYNDTNDIANQITWPKMAATACIFIGVYLTTKSSQVKQA